MRIKDCLAVMRPALTGCCCCRFWATMVDSAFAVAIVVLLFRPIEDSAILGKSLAGPDDV